MFDCFRVARDLGVEAEATSSRALDTDENKALLSLTLSKYILVHGYCTNLRSLACNPRCDRVADLGPEVRQIARAETSGS